MNVPRKYLSAKGLFKSIYDQFKKIKKTSSSSKGRPSEIKLTDCLMSGLAVFSLKFSSLLNFDERKNENRIKHNLRTLYHVDQAPSDTHMRECLDNLDPVNLRKTYKVLFAHAQKGKVLEEFKYLDNHYLLAGDGTSFFSSETTRCENCCVRTYGKCRIKLLSIAPSNFSQFKKRTYILFRKPEHSWQLYFVGPDKEIKKIEICEIEGLQELLADKIKKQLSKEEKKYIQDRINFYYRSQYPDQKETYYHNMFCAAIVHPDKKTVIPFAPEPIMKTDGSKKNDCERNGSKRLYSDLRREHPHLKLIIVEDAIASNAPHLKELKELDLKYIIGVKPGDHKSLFELIQKTECSEYKHQTKDGVTHHYRYINGVPLNDSHPDFKVNFIEYWEIKKSGEVQHFSWITDLTINDGNAYQIMKGGRCNWKIENETFNTLKNQGYHFSHNFGHGYRHLCNVFAMLMMLAFFVDQLQQTCCFLFKKARNKFRSKKSLWEEMRSLFFRYLIDTWDDLFNSIADGHSDIILKPNTS
jgi:hypothetical protein